MASHHIRIQCPECNKVMAAATEMSGRKVACQCGAKFRVPEKAPGNNPGLGDAKIPPRPETGEKQASAVAFSDLSGKEATKPAAASPEKSAGAVSEVPGQGPVRSTKAVVSTPDATRQAVEKLAEARKRLMEEVGKIIVGQTDVIDQILIAFFVRGHCVLEGVPGLAKTLMISCLADTMTLAFKRVQFTPDLMPSDITGTPIIEEDEKGRRQFVFKRGPVFTNIVLADEINRTPPKTQAALLEAMQERQVTVGGETYDLPKPFLVLATQNPIEQEGTYPLPEAQLDRFLFLVKVGYPSQKEEEKILLSTTLESLPELGRVIDGDSILRYQDLVRRVPVSPYVANYAARLARATRPGSPEAPDFIQKWVRWGCGPRAGQAMLLAAKARVVLSGGFNVSCEDVRAFVHPALRHRLCLNFAAVSEGYDTDNIIDQLVKAVPEENP